MQHFVSYSAITQYFIQLGQKTMSGVPFWYLIQINEEVGRKRCLNANSIR